MPDKNWQFELEEYIKLDKFVSTTFPKRNGY